MRKIVISSSIFFLLLNSGFGATTAAGSGELSYTVEQITHGPGFYFFGYIGQSQTIPWNGNGRYIITLHTDFHDRMPLASDAADIILIDTANKNQMSKIDKTTAWNFQQGTMFYWNPEAPETQFFFNDRDPGNGRVFTVLYDIQKQCRIREYRFEDTPFGNSGVAQQGGSFLGLNYARMARLRPVTGYPGTYDWTKGLSAPGDDGIFIVDVATGTKRLVVSFQQLAKVLKMERPEVDSIPLFINHTLWNRQDDCIYFYLRGGWEPGGVRLNVPFTVKPDGTDLRRHTIFIGGHPEWAEGTHIIGGREGRQVIYDVKTQQLAGQLGTPDIFPKPSGDISLSPDGNWFVNGYSEGRRNMYVIFRRRDGAYIRTTGFDNGGYEGDIRIDPAPRWNRDSNAILVPGIVDGSRQLFVIRVKERGPEH